MLAYFSADGITYHPQYVKMVNKEPFTSYKSQNITLSLAKRIGRFVKLELYFDNKWLLISEVNFRSQSTSKDLDFNSQGNVHIMIIKKLFFLTSVIFILKMSNRILMFFANIWCKIQQSIVKNSSKKRPLFA